MTMSRPTMELEVCTCCYIAAEYSAHEVGWNHLNCQHDDDEPLSRWVNAPAITPGWSRSDPEGEGDLAHHFSKQRCEGCGTPLAGARYWITVDGVF